MAEPYVGEIRLFAGNFAPLGWAFCAGQLLPVSENETLFALPDLRGRVPLHLGGGFTLAQAGGSGAVTLLASDSTRGRTFRWWRWRGARWGGCPCVTTWTNAA